METPAIERHPWEPFIPEGARIMILGTFPPPRRRWSIDFYYPNRTNDFWAMMGLIFYGDRYALYDTEHKNYDVEAIKRLLIERRIAMSDTGRCIRRLRGNASDKYLEIVEPLPLSALLAGMPECHTLAPAGEKASTVVASLTHTHVPAMGEYAEASGDLHIWRVPSTSRAYPLPLDKKAEYFVRAFHDAGILF